MHQPKNRQMPDKQASKMATAMQAYQFDYQVDASHCISFELPADAPVGFAQIIVVFPDAPELLTIEQ